MMEEKKFVVAQCSSLIRTSEREISEIIKEYEWYSKDEGSKVSQVFKKIS